MPTIEAYKKKLLSIGTTIGAAHKTNSDVVMEATWSSDIQSRVCYIYDYAHDDQKNVCDGMTYLSTTKTKIDAKFIVTKHPSVAGDQVEYHLQFRPSQKTHFKSGDALYYFEQDYARKYGSDFPIGLYIDIPDDAGVYHKWLICLNEHGNSFIKYLILPCNYYFHWIEELDGVRYKRKMWGVSRNQQSYNSGLKDNSVFTSPYNRDMIWFPLNDITSKLTYTQENGSGRNMRLVMSAPVESPIVWQISKVENTKPLGIQKLTIQQDLWNPSTDYIDTDDTNDIFAMYADYYSSPSIPIDEDNDRKKGVYCELSCNSMSVKIGGSYKTVTANLFSKDGTDLTSEFDELVSECNWKCYLRNSEVSGVPLIFGNSGASNKLKIKLANDNSYLGEELIVRVFINTVDLETVSQDISLEISAI